jgi:transcriptional regulator with XRE-family HTH domain
MLLDNLRHYKEASHMTFEQLAVESQTPISTIKNIFSGKSEPLASTLYRISKALKVPLEELLADAHVVLSSESIIEVKETLEEVKETANVIEAERDQLIAELDELKAQTLALEESMKLLKEQHKDEIIALVKFFTKV